MGSVLGAVSTGHLEACWGEFSASEFPEFYPEGLTSVGKHFIPLGAQF